jgi:hypothetical protein
MSRSPPGGRAVLNLRLVIGDFGLAIWRAVHVLIVIVILVAVFVAALALIRKSYIVNRKF